MWYHMRIGEVPKEYLRRFANGNEIIRSKETGNKISELVVAV